MCKIFLSIFLFGTLTALRVVSKLDFDDAFLESNETDINPYSENIHTSDMIVLKKRSESSDMYADSEIVCNGNRCVVTFKDEDGALEKNKNVANIHLKIVAKKETKEENEKLMVDESNESDEDVPVVKGYVGVDPKDIHTEKHTSDFMKTDIVIPSITLEPPKLEPKNWYEYFDMKSKSEGSTTIKPTTQSYYPYNVGGFNNGIPAGWSSGWKPIASPRTPNDYFHHNVRGREGGFVDSNPQFVTFCRCARKPVYVAKPTYRPYTHSWLMSETTTKNPLDGKLMPPFASRSP